MKKAIKPETKPVDFKRLYKLVDFLNKEQAEKLIRVTEDNIRLVSRINLIEGENNHLKDRIMSLEESNRCLTSERDFFKNSNIENYDKYMKEQGRAVEAEYNIIQMQLRVNSLVDKICKIK